MATKTKSRIFDAVYETAADLHRLGFIDKRKWETDKKQPSEPSLKLLSLLDRKGLKAVL